MNNNNSMNFTDAEVKYRNIVALFSAKSDFSQEVGREIVKDNAE